METITKDASNSSVATNARIASDKELSAMLQTVTRHDDAKRDLDFAALMATFDPAAFVEFKPAGLRLISTETIAEMYRRTAPKQSQASLERRLLREWSNQSGLIREWEYPTNSPTDPMTPPLEARRFTKQLEIFEFSDDYSLIRSYRVRMNQLYSDMFVETLGDDFPLLPGVLRVAG